jgi:hypothetical protein
MTTSWCDKLASTPAVGVFLEKHFASSGTALDRLMPVLNKLGTAKEDEFNIARQDAFGLEVALNSGFHYGVNPGHIYVDFRHRLKLKQVSGALPVMELLSEALPYTELVQQSTKRLVEAVELITAGTSRPMYKIGITSTTQLDPGVAPPGIGRLVKYVGSPWKGGMQYYDFQIVSDISKHEKWADSCIHHISFPDLPDALMTIKLDYQRTFVESRRSTAVSESFKPFVEAALLYFEQVAEGANFHVSNNDNS